MKTVFLVYNQAHTEKVEYLFDKLNIRGFTRWTGLTGRGSVEGPPHMNTHTWPEQNTARIAIVEDDAVEDILRGVRLLDEENRDIGIRAFVWDVVDGY
ncbi:MAG: hypothetical protein CSA96_08575 [Bacteroidetes bacterium]|nr:MAG: hypothetical protein CSA96_08575 [Bacteroidota bacterium]